MQTESERLERVARLSAELRERNRADGIPDMELGDRHEPAEYFAQVGFFALLERMGGPSDPDHDWSQEGGTEEDREEYLAARRRDHQRVANWLRESEVVECANRAGCYFAGGLIAWPDRIPALKVWAGQQTLAKIIRQRQKALPTSVTDVIACVATIRGSSGLYKPCATTALEDGFSVNALKMRRLTPVGLELLAIVGLETLPITVHPSGHLAYVAGEPDVSGAPVEFRFPIEDRGQYYSRFGTADRV